MILYTYVAKYVLTKLVRHMTCIGPGLGQGLRVHPSAFAGNPVFPNPVSRSFLNLESTFRRWGLNNRGFRWQLFTEFVLYECRDRFVDLFVLFGIRFSGFLGIGNRLNK